MGVPESEEIGKRAERIFKELMAKIFSNFVKNIKHPGSSMNSNYNQLDKIHSKIHHKKNFIRQRQRENLEINNREGTHYVQGILNNFNNS